MIKTTIYDRFCCIADKCPLTCCKGWAVRADGGIYEKWKSHEETSYLCEEVTYKREDGENIYHMKADSCKSCVMLDAQGLCEIVKRHGEEYLPETCADFPRKHNSITILSDNEAEEKVVMDEYSVSGACPQVLKLINDSKEAALLDIPQKCRENHDFPLEYQVRNAVIKLMQRREFSLMSRFMLAFSLLHECISCEWEDDVYDCIAVYQEEENLREVHELWQNMTLEKKDAFLEICQTWFDVTVYYKEESMYQPYLYDLADFVEKADANEEKLQATYECWEEFSRSFCRYDSFFENVLVSEIFSDCISDDLEYLTVAFQSIMLEYVMTRLTLFFRKKVTEMSFCESELFAYTSLFIRMIGHNIDGMAEYWEENFEDSILEKEYFYLLLQ